MRKKCPHYYWDNNLRHNYRVCTYCNRVQYNYTGKWENEIRLCTLVNKYLGMGNGGSDYSEAITVKVSWPFEAWTHEAWDDAYSITFHDHTAVPEQLRGKSFEWSPNLNHLDKKIQDLLETPLPLESNAE